MSFSGGGDTGCAARVEFDIDSARDPGLRRDLRILPRPPLVLITRKGAH